MPTIEFMMDDISIEVEEGSPLVEVARSAGSSIPFGCQNGVCGTCITKIISGKENLSSPEPREAQTLEMFGADDGDHRLICQCKAHGDVVLDNP